VKENIKIDGKPLNESENFVLKRKGNYKIEWFGIFEGKHISLVLVTSQKNWFFKPEHKSNRLALIKKSAANKINLRIPDFVRPGFYYFEFREYGVPDIVVQSANFEIKRRIPLAPKIIFPVTFGVLLGALVIAYAPIGGF